MVRLTSFNFVCTCKTDETLHHYQQTVETIVHAVSLTYIISSVVPRRLVEAKVDLIPTKIVKLYLLNLKIKNKQVYNWYDNATSIIYFKIKVKIKLINPKGRSKR